MMDDLEKFFRGIMMLAAGLVLAGFVLGAVFFRIFFD